MIDAADEGLMGTVSPMVDLPPPDPRDAAAPLVLRPVVPMSQWLGRMFVAAGSLALLTALALANRSRVASAIEIDLGGTTTPSAAAAAVDDQMRNADVFVAVASATMVASAVAVFVLLVAWSWRMDRNMRALGHPPRLPGPLVVAGWFVPIANLVVPFVFVRDFVRGLTALGARRGRPVRSGDYLVAWPWWIGQFAVLVVAGDADGQRTVASLADFAAADRTTAAGFVLFAASAACGAMTFRRFSRDVFDSL